MLKSQLAAQASVFDIDNKRIELKELSAQIGDPDLWRDERALAEEKSKKAGLLRELIEEFEAIDSPEALKKFEIKVLLSGKYDAGSAILSTFAGAGGDDAEDWSKMLLEMYVKYAKSRGWGAVTIDDNTIEIKGDYAYGFLKSEAGVHRLVRISPYDSKKLRHTSFALVEILPELHRIDKEIEIPEKDIRFEFSRSSGPGGQNVNKVETSVRVVHIPTGVSASCQAERSQAQNRDRAMKLLKTKLIRLMEKHQAEELSDLKSKAKPEWGSQIRSYVLHPYKLVKDHRTKVETSDVDGVLGGALDEFIESSLQLVGSKENDD